jgi:hypothetical protein
VTVAELIVELRKMPQAAPVYVYDADCARWESASEVWWRIEGRPGDTLPDGAVAIA